jgi:hypothetical protein
MENGTLQPVSLLSFRLLFTRRTYPTGFPIMHLIDLFDSALSVAAQALMIALFAYLFLAFVLEFIPRKLNPLPIAPTSARSLSAASHPSPTVHHPTHIAVLPQEATLNRTAQTNPSPQTQLKQSSNQKPDPTRPNNAQLRQLCSQHKIQWRNANPNRRHLNSAQMFQTLKTLNLL